MDKPVPCGAQDKINVNIINNIIFIIKFIKLVVKLKEISLLNINLDKYSLFFKKDIIDIYHSWININKPLYIKYYNLIGLLIMAALIPLDYILFGLDNSYSSARIIYIIIILFNLLYIQINQDSLFKREQNYCFSIHLFMPAILFNVLYIYYIYQTDITLPILLLANFITILMTTLFALKFWKEQYAINIGSILIIFLFSIASFKTLEGFYLISIHIFSFVLAYFYRRNFIYSMYEKYCNMASMVPKNVAVHIAMTDGVIELDKIFKPTNRFTVCLSSDWRNFQELTSQKDPKYIELLFQNFYNCVFKELDKIFPNGNYYADWTADELFIIFFDEENDENRIMESVASFAYIYATKVFEKINNDADIDLMYDIGLASGIGLLGLQGPEKLKKTTITGESAGTAKRLETEAKKIREKNNSKYPIMIVDEKLYLDFVKYNFFSNFKVIVAESKNIENQKFYLWTNNILDYDKQINIEF